MFGWLETSKPQRTSLAREDEITEAEFEIQKSSKALRVAVRTLGAGVGRGAVGLGAGNGSDMVIVTPMTLAVRISPSGVSVAPETGAIGPEGLLWAEFDNGVAGGLQEPVGGAGEGREWVLAHFQQVGRAPDQPIAPARRSNVQEPPELPLMRAAGIFLSLGLQARLSELRTSDFYKILRPVNEGVGVSVLLGIGADNAVRTLRRLQTGEMLGEVLPSAIGVETLPPHPLPKGRLAFLHLPNMVPTNAGEPADVPGVVQSAALVSLGLSFAGSGDKEVGCKLLREIERRPIFAERVLVSDSDSYSLAAGWAAGMLFVCRGNDIFPHQRNRLLSLSGIGLPLPPAPPHHLLPTDSATTTNLVIEGSLANVSLTSPGALIALSLIYLGSNDKELLYSLRPPATLSELQRGLRPDILFIKSLARGLIGWSYLSLTETSVDLARLSGSSESYPDSSDSKDPSLVSEARMFILAGTALALGLRYAGSNDTAAKEVLLSFAKSNGSGDDGRYCVETCQGVALLAASMVGAGTGDLDILRAIRSARKTAESGGFGLNMAISIAAGFLFIGCGKLSLVRDGYPSSYPSREEGIRIGCLLMSTVARFPSFPGDNHFVLQPCRHLYVIAAVEKGIEQTSRGNDRSQANADDRIRAILERIGFN